MTDNTKTKEQLLTEVKNLHQRISDLEFAEEKRIEAENAMVESEGKYQNLYNNAEVGLFQIGLNDGKIITCNQYYAEKVGYDDIKQFKEEYVTWEHYVDSKLRSKMIEEIQRNGEIKNFEVEITDRYGIPRWWSCSAKLYPDRDIIEGAIVEITERKGIEKKLADSYASLEAMFECGDLLMMIADHRGRISMWNKKYEGIMKALLGLDLEKGMKPHTFLDDKNLITQWDDYH
jgi:PAS domain S-box-containing protein